MGDPIRLVEETDELHYSISAFDRWRRPSPPQARRLHRQRAPKQGTQTPPGARQETPWRRYYKPTFPPDNKYIATADDLNKILLLERKTGVIYHHLEGQTKVIKNITSSSNSRLLASCGYDNTVRLWGIEPGVPATNLISDHHARFIASVEFSPDCSLVATGGEDSKAKVWDAATGQLVRTTEEMPYWIGKARITPNSELLALGCDDGSVSLLKIQTGYSIVALDAKKHHDGSDSPIQDIQFSHSGRLVVASSNENRGKGMEHRD
ncbi:WD40 repeat-like protein [Penicillium malachiteum]|uniref:WD40 repeat-like protein n=1 Tax=Penicillium malachiteum TaxID=1324776 RepID=UPI0025487B00|nr:WD40 repeat-like protein [Penicillium malachiteum]KAJ5714415.1 WD40 repeat-like protein [Penicillium malachiteum]